jgi:hypothetical protein
MFPPGFALLPAPFYEGGSEDMSSRSDMMKKPSKKTRMNKKDMRRRRTIRRLRIRSAYVLCPRE